jgi:hypothetical protein
MSSTLWSHHTGYATLKKDKSRNNGVNADHIAPITKRPAGGSDKSKTHWADVSDERLVTLDLVIDGPDTLPGIVTEIPEGDEETYMECTYDLRGTGREQEFVCVHGHHRHLHGAVMRKGQARFLVGWICADSIYGEDLEKYKADFNAAVQRQGALIRVRELREAMAQFSGWVDQVAKSKAVEGFETVRATLKHRFPWLYQVLQSRAGAPINDAKMPRYLCAETGETGDLEGSFIRLMNETAAVSSRLTGNSQRVAGSIGAIRSDIEGIIRRAELLIAKLSDVQLFFQPATLLAICEHAENAVPRRTRHFAGLLKLSTRDQVVEMPRDFVVPSSAPLERLSAVLSS